MLQILLGILAVLVIGITIVTVVSKGHLGIVKIPQAHAMVIERLGRYHRTIDSGLHVVWPILDSPRKLRVRYVAAEPQTGAVRAAKDAQLETLEQARTIVRETAFIDLREQVMNFPQQTVITKDNVVMDLDAVLFYQITEPHKAIYEVNDMPYAIEMLTMTTLRSVVGEMDLDETLSQRETINARLRQALDATGKWGVKVTRVEIQDIRPPASIQEAMKLQMEAERKRRAAVTQAEGERQAKILQADGDREAAIRKAQGEAEALLQVAQARSMEISKIKEAIGRDGNAASYLVALKYLEALQEISKGQATKIFLPFEASGVLGALAGIREMLGGAGDEERKR